MATESQWRAVIQAMAEAAGSIRQSMNLLVFPDRSGRISYFNPHTWTEGTRSVWGAGQFCSEVLDAVGIPIAPDPPASTVKTRFVPEGPAQPLPFPDEPYALSTEGRIELLADFTKAALTGLATLHLQQSETHIYERAVFLGRETLRAFEAATRDLAEKGGE